MDIFILRTPHRRQRHAKLLLVRQGEGKKRGEGRDYKCIQ
jgi:hypothetical protein